MLEVENINTIIDTDEGPKQVTDRVSFYIDDGETVCLLGESGSGKSVTSFAIMGLLGKNGKITGGRVSLAGQDLSLLSEEQMDAIRGNEVSMIFQDAMTALNPVFTVENQLVEPIRIHLKMGKKEARQYAIKMLEKVGLARPEQIMKEYPHALSGGMRQRVMIAIALCCNPKLLIADEPTTALDVTIQAQILDLMRDLQQQIGMSMLLITHDIGVVAEMADRVLIMYAGQIVEQAPAQTLFDDPRHPYTQGLMAAVPTAHTRADKPLSSIPGSVPSDYQNMQGCRFYDRCKFARDVCKQEPEFVSITPEHKVKCWFAKEVKRFGQ